MTQQNIVVAIDGYSACGKSTVAKALAQRLNFVYIDTGAMYRAATLYFLRENIDLTNGSIVQETLQNIHIDLFYDGVKNQVFLNQEDVSHEIREMNVTSRVSQVSAIKAVRQFLVKQQQQIARSKNVVMDGRDIGSVVFPDAQVKVFMTADPLVRAQRRFDELVRTNSDVTLEEVFESLAHRDFEDTSRAESPLVHLKEAITLDNTNLSKEEQLDFLVKKIQAVLLSNEVRPEFKT